MHRPILSACAVTVMLSAGACTIDQRETAPTEAAIELLTWTEQMAVRDVWLTKRHDMLLPMMRRHGIGMWIVVNEEFHDDPLTQYVAPARPYTGRRDIFVFVDAGDAGLRKVAATGYWEETVARFFESPIDPKPAGEVPGTTMGFAGLRKIEDRANLIAYLDSLDN